MKKETYGLFTVRNGIRMDMQTLAYISEHAENMDDLESMLQGFKARFNTPEVTISQLKMLNTEDQPAKELFKVHSLRHAPARFSERYEAFKKRVGRDPVPLSLLEEGVESFIFGIFYQNRNGEPTLEDGHGTIGLGLSSCESNAFLFENMLVGFEGILVNANNSRQFAVKAVILPPIRPCEEPNNFLDKKQMKVCVIGCLEGAGGMLGRIEAKYKPDMFVVSMCCKQSLCTNLPTIVFTCACNSIPCPVPKSYAAKMIAGNDFDNARSGSCVSTSNPFLLEFNNTKIAFISSNLFRHKENGLFINKQPLESFVRAMQSQYAFDPSSRSDLSYERVLPFGVQPNIYVVLQDFQSYVMDIENVIVACLSPIKSRQIMMIDVPSGSVELKSVDEETGDPGTSM